jgi:hypothetical protein
VAVPDVEDVEHMCALLTSCPDLPLPPQLTPSDFASCVRSTMAEMLAPAAITFSLTMRECGLRSNSCGELRKCALRGAKPDACKGRGREGISGHCDADGRAITCFRERVLAVRDCPRGGELCSVRDGEATCSLGPCGDMKDSAAPSCSASGTRIVRCEKGRLVGLDCSAFGLRCEAGADGAHCVTGGAACSGEGRRCEKNVALACLHGREVRIDCGAAGLSCAPNSAASAAKSSVGVCALPAASAPTCDDGAPARCDGATLRYCSQGKPRAYLCKSLNFARCVADRKGARCAS